MLAEIRRRGPGFNEEHLKSAVPVSLPVITSRSPSHTESVALIEAPAVSTGFTMSDQEKRGWEGGYPKIHGSSGSQRELHPSNREAQPQFLQPSCSIRTD